MLDSAINLLGLAIAVATIIGVYIVYFVFKTFRDDKSFGVSHVPEVQSLEQEGWDVVFSDQNDDYGLLAQVYKFKSEKKYRVILSVTESPQNVMVDEELSSYSEAEDWAKDWLNSYNADASQE